MRQPSLQLDARRRAVNVDGRTTVLKEKSWQVLSMLVAGAPAVVSRAEIINRVWQGNFLTGEKGLNQAIWALRAALADDSRRPIFIRTVPRVGYRWLYVDTGREDTPAPAQGLSGGLKAATLAGIALVTGTLVVGASQFASSRALFANSDSPATTEDKIAINAYLVNADIHVKFAAGCLAIVKNSGGKEFGAPLISADGREIAFTVTEPAGCHMMTIDVATGEKRKFRDCPVI